MDGIIAPKRFGWHWAFCAGAKKGAGEARGSVASDERERG